MNKPLLIKLGGAVLENNTALANLFDALTRYLTDNQRSLILVHGGGIVVEDVLSKMGIKSEKKNGLRITPFEQIPYVAGALAGTSNKLLMAKALQAGLSAVGLSLADGFSTKVTQLDPELGAVGQCKPNDPTLLKVLLAANQLPVISSIGIGEDGRLYNVNADQAAIAICELVGAELVFLSDVDGVLDGNQQLIPELNTTLANELIAAGVIRDGMTVKVQAALEAAETLGHVMLASWKQPENLIALLKGDNKGTKVLK
ncbi:acetylglutamate kinase [Motilimonas sp. 1_MG-2023]|uniref:acetylglutamate kinase n=1 Tax=Motilimonas sp. 1_MG-2023 TaxID=3062672 RepID=UPI0026E48629|nr:acetylglutamate kinase [Motilimonas sp. 1_MG-2023]MDO6527078.1 acetylglutamate kinase [Motilimonas sp. 1_MG-2023]